MPNRLAVAFAVSVLIAVTGSPTRADLTAEATCKEAKAKAAGKKAFSLLKAHGRNTKKPHPAKLTADISKAESRFTKAFVHEESRGGCLTTGDAGTIEEKVNAFIADVIEEVSGITPTTTMTATTTIPITTSTTTSSSSTTTDTASTTTTTLPSGALERIADPVVLTGAMVSSLTGLAPGDVVAFRHDAGGWTQIPVQVDERDVINFDDVYNHVGSYGGGITVPDYTDSETFTGPDSDPTLDGDDEVVFMAKDAGDEATATSEPPGVVADSGLEIVITDPVGPGIGYAYLFEQDGSLDPGAGQQYVGYQFNLLSGNYKTTYKIGSGPNPENTTVLTDHYARHFSDRWIQDELRIFTATSTGVDVLDRHKFLFDPGNCGRSEDTFSNGEGAFVVNKGGPVRAIRSYLGANSGPLSQRQHCYYERREDIATFLRVHAIGGGMDFFDYSPAATAMTYRNNNNLVGVTINGVPDNLKAGSVEWELVTGPQGSLVMVGILETDIVGLAPTSYYLDDTTPPVIQCTGDAFAYGASGTWIAQGIPNTDPRNPPAQFLTATRVIYYGAPGMTVADAEQRKQWVASPLSITASVWP